MEKIDRKTAKRNLWSSLIYGCGERTMQIQLVVMEICKNKLSGFQFFSQTSVIYEVGKN